MSFFRSMLHASCFMLHKRGQVMLLTVLALGGTILAGTTMAGLLVVYQIRQTTDFANSAKAVFSADSGIEWALYQFFKGATPAPIFSNGASAAIVCYDNAAIEVLCSDPGVNAIRAVGKSGTVSRAFEQRF